MDFNYIDIVVVSLVVLLGLKGLINGLIKEFFGLLGIVGGVFVASRYASEVGRMIDGNFYKFANESALSLVGFIVILASFWLGAVLFGALVSKLAKVSAMGGVDRIFGFVFGAGKVFLIFAVIVYALSNIEIIKNNTKKYTQESMVYPVLIEVGSLVVRLDPISKIENNETKKEF